LTVSQKKILEEIENAYKDKSRIKKWYVVADRYLKSYGNDKFERHWKAEDIVMELTGKILDGKRSWDSEHCPNFDRFICMNIRSIVDSKLRNRKRVLPQKERIQVRYGDKETDLVETNYITDKDYILYNIELTEKLEKCYDLLSDDDECALVFLEWKEEKTSLEIADSLGITVEEVERIKKRLRYKIKRSIKYN